MIYYYTYTCNQYFIPRMPTFTYRDLLKNPHHSRSWDGWQHTSHGGRHRLPQRGGVPKQGPTWPGISCRILISCPWENCMSGLNYIPIYKHHKHWVIRLEKMNFFGKTAKIHILREPWPFRLVQQLLLWDVQPSLCTKVSSEFRSVRLPSTLMFLGPTRFLWDKSYGNPTV